MKKNQTQKIEQAAEPSVAVDGGTLVIRLPLYEKARPAASGKSLTIAGTRGNRKASVKFKGRDLFFQATAWVEPEVL